MEVNSRTFMNGSCTSCVPAGVTNVADCCTACRKNPGVGALPVASLPMSVAVAVICILQTVLSCMQGMLCTHQPVFSMAAVQLMAVMCSAMSGPSAPTLQAVGKGPATLLSITTTPRIPTT